MNKQAKARIDGVARLLALEPRSRILDVGCGAGRETLELSRRGHRVLGIDPDEAALAQARAAAKGERLNVHFMKADPREISYRGDFDAVVFLDGSFGRLPSDRDDARALDNVRKALKPGAKLLLDVPNRERLIRRLAPNGPPDFDFEKGRLWDGLAPSRRVYALAELIGQLERAGLLYCRSWGGFDGAAYGLESPRLLVLAERPRDERPARKTFSDGLPTAIRIKGRR
ncbi:MAG: class I SAM-dependent methyltransferase [Elusimicrobiota bacterium]